MTFEKSGCAAEVSTIILSFTVFFAIGNPVKFILSGTFTEEEAVPADEFPFDVAEESFDSSGILSLSGSEFSDEPTSSAEDVSPESFFRHPDKGVKSMDTISVTAIMLVMIRFM